ncbi:hypothetical protein B0T14DRAFT_23848 [Immersiella caudata]|uniref:Uncharacterized protein n=1 Tax=Immersiella caudata TaxID=314043 RepID=A0AA39XEI8_9PEZI|nr:hypothetical protein B0T14DRAFT_23848 [Immersiella caudata]
MSSQSSSSEDSYGDSDNMTLVLLKKKNSSLAAELKAYLELIDHYTKVRKDTDLTITCKERIWMVRRAVISRCWAFTHDARVPGGRVDMPGDDPKILDCMIQFLYFSDYDPPRTDRPGLIHTEVHAIAARCSWM